VVLYTSQKESCKTSNILNAVSIITSLQQKPKQKVFCTENVCRGKQGMLYLETEAVVIAVGKRCLKTEITRQINRQRSKCDFHVS